MLVVYRPIADYGLLSDRHSAALVSTEGSVDWLCFPRFDSPSVFAALLGSDAGHWSIRPSAPATVSRRYATDTLVLETRFTTATGVLVLTDALVVGSTDDPHRLGADAPHVLTRQVACLSGTVEVTVAFRPRPEYGLVAPLLSGCLGGMVARGGSVVLVLTCPIHLAITDEATAAGTVTLQAGQTVRLALQWAPLGGPPPRPWGQDEIGRHFDTTLAAWRAWSAAHRHYLGAWHDQVHHSGRVLHALTYQPTGAIVAAATTSLPEVVEGERNWDYRYTWIRDAALTMDALWIAACPKEAYKFFTFMTCAAATVRPDTQLQIMFGIGGERDLTERRLPHLPGWRASHPVRVGNAAWTQSQLDVYGELLATAARFADQLPEDDISLHAFLTSLADRASDVWRHPDHGIWEIRGEPRHFLHSKLMCWAALDRAVALADRIHATDHVDRWHAAREEIRRVILEYGWSDAAGAYTQSFGSTDLDAAALMIPIIGFAPAGDPRVLSTIDAVGDRLTDRRGLVHRYSTETGVDGLPGGEGAFLLCTFWLAQAYALAGQLAQACQVFERALAYGNDLGLLAEQVDPVSGELLGNFPQAFSHIGLINAACAIAEAQAEPRASAAIV
jgi:GH15 family glucan-1,4-alpha-glucosidase